MTITMLKSKIHRATDNTGRVKLCLEVITIDIACLRLAGIYEYEKVQVVDVESGSRLETYTIAGERGSGVICLNGAAARLVQPQDHVIIMAYCDMNEDEAKKHKPKVVFMKEDNTIDRISTYERHGEIC